MSTAIAAYGTILKIGSTAVVEVKKVDLPALKLDTQDVTTHGSTAGWREHIGTLLDGGDVSIEINYVPTAATHKNASGGLIYLMVNKTVQAFSIVCSDGGATTWTFNAIVTGFKATASVDGVLTAAVTLKVTGQPTLP